MGREMKLKDGEIMNDIILYPTNWVMMAGIIGFLKIIVKSSA